MAALAPLPKSARKPKGDGHLRRAEILAAAQRIFVEHGYQGATVRRIADEVGVSPTALYMHFRDKSEIMLEICRDAFARIVEPQVRILALPLDPVERVRLVLDAYLDFATENPDVYWLVFNRGPGERLEAEAHATAHALGRECFARFETAVAEVAATGRLQVEAEVAAQALWAAVHGLATLLISKSDFDWAAPDVLRGALLDSLFRGLVRP